MKNFYVIETHNLIEDGQVRIQVGYWAGFQFAANPCNARRYHTLKGARIGLSAVNKRIKIDNPKYVFPELRRYLEVQAVA